MLTANCNGTYTVKTDAYQLRISNDCIDFIIAGEALAGLRPVTAVNTCGDGDATNTDADAGAPCLTAATEDGLPVFIWTAASNLWQKKEYIVRCFDEHFEYSVRLTGSGAVDTVNYFSGSLAESCPGSMYAFDTGFTPIVTVTGQRQCRFSAMDENVNEFSYLMVPPMFVYSFSAAGVLPKAAFALAAKQGEHNFTQFNYRTKSENFSRRFWFWTDQSGHTAVNGVWETPRILCYPAESDMDALKFYCDYYFSHGIAKMKKPAGARPRWWYGPIACGWTEQTAYAIKYKDAGGACEKIYTHFVDEMKNAGLHPQLLIIDDKWQQAYGNQYPNTDMFPDLRRFIDGMLEKNNIRTMLWFKLWDGEGLNEDMLMHDTVNNCMAVDPTNPKTRERLRHILYTLLSSDKGCCNAFGLKLDYAFRQPLGRGANSFSGKYGVELFLEYIRFIHDCVKEIKPEAIINASPCHPLFAEYIDQARLHDYYPDLRRTYEEFCFRADCYRAALPGVLIDTDGASFTHYRDTMRWMRLAPKVGIPDLYCFTDMPSLTLDAQDWAVAARAWQNYSKRIDAMF